MIRAGIFDFGGVMTTNPREGLYRYEQSLGLPRGALYRVIVGDDDGHGLWHRLERREISAKRFWREVNRRAREELGVRITLRGVAGSFAGSFGPRPAMIALVRELRRKIRTVLLTNNVAEFTSLWRPIIPVEELFDRVIDSSAVGLRKPDPRIFRLALEAALVTPAEAIFVDDTLEHVLAAERMGIRSIHFTDERESATIAQIRTLVYGSSAESHAATHKG